MSYGKNRLVFKMSGLEPDDGYKLSLPDCLLANGE